MDARYPLKIKENRQLGKIFLRDHINEMIQTKKIFFVINWSAQPTLSTASEQALKYGYPTWSLLTSTPNKFYLV